jgi:Ca2+-transporting ATPase
LTTHSRAAATVTPLVSADPRVLDGSVRSIASLADVLARPALTRVAPVVLAPEIILLVNHDADAVALSWVVLPERPMFDGTPVAAIALLDVRPGEAAMATRAVARLATALADPHTRTRAVAARTRTALVEALAAAEATPGETAVDESVAFAVLDSQRAGLTHADAARRLAAIGGNELQRVARRSLASRFAGQFTSLFAVLLWIGSALAYVAGLPELAWAIVVVIAVNGTFSFLQEVRAERTVEALRALLPRRIIAVRDGAETTVDVTSLVPGDIIRLVEGDQVPADGRLLEAANLRIDQSALTGESHTVLKVPARGRDAVPRLDRPELVFAGTAVASGEGTALVTATGMATEIGAIARLTQALHDESSPLQREMERVTRMVALLAIAIGLVFFVLGVGTGRLPLTAAFVFALGVIVANVPEGLLPTLTLALALAVQKLARAGILVKRLSAVETLGSATVICTDKTGTLTEGRMEARHLWIGGGIVPVSADASARRLLEAAVLASVANTQHGDPTEIALIAAAARAGLDPDALRRAHPVVTPYPFDAFRKRMTLVREDDGRHRAWVKGAPVETLALCTHVHETADVTPLSEARRRAILADHDRLAGEGLRILAIAVRTMPGHCTDEPADVVEQQLTFVGLVALWDPPRAEVPAAIAQCLNAGMRVVMITGDYGLTAQAVARTIGLPATTVVSGAEIDRLPAETLRQLARAPGVLFARTSPTHKLAVVQALRGGGDVVAVTGDGVNDAPALKAADIGVAMGRRGTEVAKEAAEMVLVRDDFTAVVTAVRLGRTAWANIGKFVTYIFASNVPELVPFLAFVFLGVPLPLTIMQILAVDLGTDLLPALALGAEPPEPGVMTAPPRPRGERLLGRARLVRAYLFLGMIEAAVAMFGFFFVYWLDGWRPGLPMAAEGELYQRATTMTLAAIVAAQVGNVFACRTDRESLFRVGVFGNRLIVPAVLAEVGVLLALIYVPPFPRFFGLVPLGAAEWALLTMFPFVVIGLEEARKWLVRRRG